MRLRRGTLLLNVFLVVGGFGTAQGAAAQEVSACSKVEFESVVDDAAAALRDLNNKNRPAFQDQLRKLKDKRGWTNDQFLVEAAPYVKDDQIEVYDTATNDLLAKISTMGEEGATANVPDCAMLQELRGQMTTLIATQADKWSYMFKKLSTELEK